VQDAGSRLVVLAEVVRLCSGFATAVTRTGRSGVYPAILKRTARALPVSMPWSASNGALFPLGRLVATLGALTALTAAGENPVVLLARHQSGDWGSVGPADRRANDRNLREGGRLLSVSAYDVGGSRVWTITEADRSATTILLPAEY